MSVSHGLPVVSGVFDDPNLVSCAGLVPVLGLGRRCGVEPLLRARLTVSGPGSADPAGKTVAVLAGMLAGADSIEDLGLVRHGGLPRLLGRVWAPSTLGSFLRSFRFGHVRSLDAVAARLAQAVPLLPGVSEVAFVEVDDTIREVHGYRKQGAGFGYSGVRGLNALLATVSTPLAAPVIAATRLRRGSVNSARGARRLLTDALVVARQAGATGLVIVRADSAYYTRDVITAATQAGARFSVTARLNPAVHTAIAAIPESGWTAIRYPQAVFDAGEQRWISDAEVAETPSPRSRRDREPTGSPPGSSSAGSAASAAAPARASCSPATATTRCSPTPPLPNLDAGICHRKHAIIEQVIADLKAGPLTHLPSGRFTANAAWLALAAISFNLTRAACAGPGHARAATATLRRRLVTGARPPRVLSAPVDPAPTARLAVAARLAGAVHHRLRTTRACPPMTTRPTGPTGDLQWKSRADRQDPHAPIHHPQPDPEQAVRTAINHSPRWIQAQLASLRTRRED